MSLAPSSGNEIIPSSSDLEQMCAACFDSVMRAFAGRSASLLNLDLRSPLFVTWNKRQGTEWALRGCIGTFSPEPLSTGVAKYARVAAFDDSRFPPLKEPELSQLRVSISLLVQFEECGPFDWEVGFHGLRISFTESGEQYSATYLPEVAKEQGWDQQTTVESLVRKAGFRGRLSSHVVASIRAQRYQSLKHSLTFAEYQNAWGSS